MKKPGLGLLGAGSVLPYAGLLAAMHFRSMASEPGRWLDGLPAYWRFLDRHVVSLERLRAPDAHGGHVPEAAWFTACFLAASILYLLVVRKIRNASPGQPPRLGALLGLTAASALPLLVLPHLLSTDLFHYVQHGRTYAVHGENPYVVPPAGHPEDPYAEFVFWKGSTCPYGPVWVQASGLLTLGVEAIGSSLATYFLAYKALALALHLLAGWLVWTIVADWLPESRAFAAALYLLNPLCLVEFAGNGHNDVLMIVWILAAVLAYQRGRWHAAVGALALGTLTKLYAMPALVLFVALAAWQAAGARERAARLGISILICLALFGLLHVGLWHGPETLSIADDPSQSRAINSLGEAVGNALFGLYLDLPRFFLPETRLGPHRLLRNAALAFPAAVFLAGIWLARDLRRTVTLLGWGFFALWSVGAVWFWPWYVTVLVALVAIALAPGLTGPSLLLSLLAPLVYVVHAWIGDGRILEPVPHWLHRTKPLILFLPPIALAAASLARSRRRRDSLPEGDETPPPRPAQAGSSRSGS